MGRSAVLALTDEQILSVKEVLYLVREVENDVEQSDLQIITQASSPCTFIYSYFWYLFQLSNVILFCLYCCSVGVSVCVCVCACACVSEAYTST